MKQFYVYILESASSNKWYYGYSENPERRVQEHNEGKNRYTRNKGPWTIIFVKPFESKSEALRFEKYLKKTRNKEFIRKEFSEYFL